MTCKGCGEGCGEKRKVKVYYARVFPYTEVEYYWVALGMYGDCRLRASEKKVYVGEEYKVSLNYTNTSFRFLQGKLYVRHSDGYEETLWSGRIYPKSAVSYSTEVTAGDEPGKEIIKFDVKPLLFGGWSTECSTTVKVEEKPAPPPTPPPPPPPPPTPPPEEEEPTPPPPPPEKPKVVVFANDIDWDLCKDDLQECLGDEYELVWTQSKSEYEKYDKRIILGGPKAKVVGDEVQKICDAAEPCVGRDLCDELCKKNYTMVAISMPTDLSGNYDCHDDEHPVTLVFMGYNRCYTEHCIGRYCDDLKDYLRRPDFVTKATNTTIKECEPEGEKPKEKPKIVVFANDIDWELCRDDLKKCFEPDYELVWTQSKSEYEKYDRRIILGGPKAKVVGDEVQRICDAMKKCVGEDYCDKLCKGEYTMVVMGCPSSGGRYDCRGTSYPYVLVFMGKNRCYTERIVIHYVKYNCEDMKRLFEDHDHYFYDKTSKTISECES